MPYERALKLGRALRELEEGEAARNAGEEVRSPIGGLLYAVRGTRPDMAWGCSQLARFVELLEWDWEWTMFDNPVYGSQAGFHENDDHLQQLTPAAFLSRAAHAAHLRECLDEEAQRGELPREAALQWRAYEESPSSSLNQR